MKIGAANAPPLRVRLRRWDITRGVALPQVGASTARSSVRRTLFGHSAEVRATDWSGDSSRSATGSGDGSVRVWDIAEVSGGEWAAVPIDGWETEPLAVAADGRHILTTGPTRAVTMWDPRTGTKVGEFGDDKPAALVATGGGDSLIVAVSEDSTLTAWDAASGKQRFTSLSTTESTTSTSATTADS